MSDNYREVRFLCERAEEAEKTTANIDDCFNASITFSFSCTSLDQLVRTRSASLGQLPDGLFQGFSRDFSESLTGLWYKLCHNFLQLSFAQDDALKSSVAGLRTLTDGYGDAADAAVK